MIVYTKYPTLGQTPVADTQCRVEAGVTLAIHNLVMSFSNENPPKLKHYHFGIIFQ